MQLRIANLQRKNGIEHYLVIGGAVAKKHINAIDNLVEKNVYLNRSEFIRIAVIDKLKTSHPEILEEFLAKEE